MAYEAEVAAGAAWLDEQLGPGYWHNALNPAGLEMAYCSACVVGQLVNSTLCDQSLLVQLKLDTGEYYPSKLGFDIPPEHSITMFGEEYLKLEEAWLAEIKRRCNDG